MASTYTRTTNNSGSTSTTTTTSKTAATGKVDYNTLQNYNKYNQDYRESERVTNAYNQLQKTLQNQPTQFSSTYQSKLDDIYSQITNGEKFNFDVNNSVMYKQLKDQYSALGKLAMKDTMGQASAMTGGYGSSYTQTAGQQQYQQYMQNLNEQLPSIYSMELSKYQADRDDLYKQYDTTKGLYDTEYATYRDKVSDWQADRNYYTDYYNNERTFDYNKYQTDRSYWNSEYWNERNAETTTTTNSTTNTSNWSNSYTESYSPDYGTSSSSSSSSNSSSSSSSNVAKNQRGTNADSGGPVSNSAKAQAKQTAMSIANNSSYSLSVKKAKLYDLYNQGLIEKNEYNLYVNQAQNGQYGAISYKNFK